MSTLCTRNIFYFPLHFDNPCVLINAITSHYETVKHVLIKAIFGLKNVLFNESIGKVRLEEL